jgi:hypothetical protein
LIFNIYGARRKKTKLTISPVVSFAPQKYCQGLPPHSRDFVSPEELQNNNFSPNKKQTIGIVQSCSCLSCILSWLFSRFKESNSFQASGTTGGA